MRVQERKNLSLLTGEIFNPSDYEELHNPNPAYQEMTVANALAFLEAQGFDTSKLVV